MPLSGRKISETSWIQVEYFIMYLSFSAVDYRLNPVLRKACKADIPKFCHGILTKAKDDSELEGQVISCLKLRYADQVNWRELSREVCLWSRRSSWQLFLWASLTFSSFPKTVFIRSPSQGPSKKLQRVRLTCSPFVTCSASLQTAKTRSGLLSRSPL